MMRDLPGLIRQSLDDYADTLSETGHISRPQDGRRLIVAPTASRSWRRRWAVPLAAAAASVLVAVALLTLAQQHRTTSQTTASGSGAIVETTFGGLTLPHPAAWASVPADSQSYGDSSIIGYLTSQRPGRQCSTPYANPGEVDCQPLITLLQPDGVLVTVVAYSLGGDNPSPNGTVAGLPSTFTRGAASSQPGFCPTGASTFSSAYFAAPGTAGPIYMRVTGSFGATVFQSAQRAFNTMLAGATHHRGG